MSQAHATIPEPIRPRPYLYVEQLAELTPWTVQAINEMCRDGILKRGVHWFQQGRKARRIFKWTAIVDHIETQQQQPSCPTQVRTGVNIEAATEKLQRLLS